MTLFISSHEERDFRSKVELLLMILLICDEEGEDLEFNEVLSLAENLIFSRELKDLIKELRRYGDLPPRVALAKLMLTPSWRRALEKASLLFLKEILD